MWEVPDYDFPIFEKEEAQPTYCAFSLQYRGWAMELVGRTLAEPNHVAINQAKVMLLDKYYEWKATIPKRHSKRHLCIDSVLDRAYQSIKSAELALTPPQLYLPEPPKRNRRKKDDNDSTGTDVLGEIIHGF